MLLQCVNALQHVLLEKQKMIKSIISASKINRKFADIVLELWFDFMMLTKVSFTSALTLTTLFTKILILSTKYLY